MVELGMHMLTTLTLMPCDHVHNAGAHGRGKVAEEAVVVGNVWADDASRWQVGGIEHVAQRAKVLRQLVWIDTDVELVEEIRLIA